MGRFSAFYPEMIELGHDIQALDFGTSFVVHPNGQMLRSDVYAPDVFHDDDADITIDGVPMRESTRWEALTGMTGQHGYRGAVMHSSEFIGSGIAARLAEIAEDEPQTFVVVVVEVHPEDDELTVTAADIDQARLDLGDTATDAEATALATERVRDMADPEPAGWAILRYKGDE